MPGARQVLAIGGTERVRFLQDLVTNDLAGLKDGLVYAALLSPQGKYLADFFLKADGDRILLDVAADLAAGLAQRLSMYKLRADVTIEALDMASACGTSDTPDGALPDPRHPALGWRAYGHGTSDGTDWEALRVAHCIPESGIELVPNDTYILEAGFERLNGVDFKKGCYVGQEVTARMKHKTELRKGLATVDVKGTAPVGSDITRDGKTVGSLYTQAGGRGIAYMRFDRAGPGMMAGSAEVSLP